MALHFTVSYDVPVSANYAALTPLVESGRLRDINGNSYSRDEIDAGDSLSGEFVASIAEEAVNGWTVGDVVDVLTENSQALAGAFLLSEEDYVVVGDLEVGLDADPNRCAYGDADTPDQEVWLISRNNIVVSITSERDSSEIIAAAGE